MHDKKKQDKKLKKQRRKKQGEDMRGNGREADEKAIGSSAVEF
jgi:hypothetical protein